MDYKQSELLQRWSTEAPILPEFAPATRPISIQTVRHINSTNHSLWKTARELSSRLRIVAGVFSEYCAMNREFIFTATDWKCIEMSLLKRLLPFLHWLPELHNLSVLRQDVVAGVSVAMILVPQAMAYAQLAGLPPYYGLYAALVPAVIAALWGSSRQLKTGPVAVVSLLTASILLPLAQEGSQTYIALAVLLALLVGVIQLLLGVCRVGHVVNFLSYPVLLGFTNAAAIIIALSQAHHIFGLAAIRSDFFLLEIYQLLKHLPLLHLPSATMALTAFASLWLVKRYWPKVPGVLIAVSLTSVCSWSLGFSAMGAKVVGTIPSGVPSLQIPWSGFGPDTFAALLPPALVIAVIGYMEAISIAKYMAMATKQRIDPNQELIGQGLANICGSFTQAYPCSGSFSRSAVNLHAGARTGFSSVVSSVSVLFTLLFLTPLLYHVPIAVLAVVIVAAVSGLVNLKAMARAWRVHRHDGAAAWVTFIATLLFAPHLEKGIALGAGLAIGLYLYRTMRPRVNIVSRDLWTFPTLIEEKPALDDDRLVVISFDEALYFANAAYFEDTVHKLTVTHADLSCLLLLADGINHLDASGEQALRHSVDRLHSQGIIVALSGVRPQVLAVLKKSGLYELVGAENIYATKGQALVCLSKRLGVTSSGHRSGPVPSRRLNTTAAP